MIGYALAAVAGTPFHFSTTWPVSWLTTSKTRRFLVAYLRAILRAAWSFVPGQVTMPPRLSYMSYPLSLPDLADVVFMPLSSPRLVRMTPRNVPNIGNAICEGGWGQR